jgi:hypothetical protein
MTCWRRLWERQEAGVWERFREALLAKLHEAARRLEKGSKRRD